MISSLPFPSRTTTPTPRAQNKTEQLKVSLYWLLAIDSPAEPGNRSKLRSEGHKPSSIASSEAFDPISSWFPRRGTWKLKLETHLMFVYACDNTHGEYNTIDTLVMASFRTLRFTKLGTSTRSAYESFSARMPQTSNHIRHNYGMLELVFKGTRDPTLLHRGVHFDDVFGRRLAPR